MGQPLESCCNHPLHTSRVFLQRHAAVRNTWTHAVVPSMPCSLGGEQHSLGPGFWIHPWLHMCLLARFGKAWEAEREAFLQCQSHKCFLPVCRVISRKEPLITCVTIFQLQCWRKRLNIPLFVQKNTNVLKKKRIKFYLCSAVKFNFSFGGVENAGSSLGSAGGKVQVRFMKRKAQPPHLSALLHPFLFNWNTGTGFFWFYRIITNYEIQQRQWSQEERTQDWCKEMKKKG